MKKTFKKSLAVLMTAVIMLSCWVWVVPTEASAANYDVTIKLDIGDYKGSWFKPLKFNDMDYSKANITVYCYDHTGKSTSKIINVSNSSDVCSVNFSMASFPNKIEFELAYLTPYTTIGGGWEDVDATISVGGISASFIIDSANIKSMGTSTHAINAGIGNINLRVNYVRYTMKILPSGYNFDEDSYSFSNNRSANISKKYYSTLFEPSVADVVYEETHKASGLCYGFVYTTAAIYNGNPNISSFVPASSDPFFSITDLTRNTMSLIDPIYDNHLSSYDYIKYAYLYQYSQEALDLLYSTAGNALGLLNTVKSKTDNNHMGVAVGFSKRDDAPSSAPGGHEVLAVGYAGNTILIDNPNNTSSLEKLIVNSDGSWNFGSYNSEHHVIDYAVNIHRPYQLLMTGERVTGWDSIINKDSSVSEGEYYVDGMEKLDSEYTLVRINSDSFELSSDDYLEIPPSKSGLEEASNNKMFWIRDTNSVTISELSEDTVIDYAGDNTILSVDATKGSEVTMTINEDDIKSEIKAKEGEPYVVSVKTITTDNDYINSDSVISVIATASSDTVTATQTETGLLVTGISDGTVTLTKDEEVIATEEIKDAIGDIEITYDKEGESEDLDADYHTHSYESAETKAATCKDKGELTYTCSCNDSYTEEIEINPYNHIGETEIRNIKDSTCTEKGYTGDTYCLDCGAKIADGKETDIKGHTDNDGNNSCDVCGETLKACSHICHKTGFMGFIWKILRIFFKLFGVQPVCSCGVAHY